MNDRFEEKLPDGGILVVDRSGWGIDYTPESVRAFINGFWVSGEEIEQYIAGLLANWSEYERLMEDIPNGTVYRKEGKLKMKIVIGGYDEGIGLDYNARPISNKQQIDKIMESWRYAAKRGPELLLFLKSL